MDHLSNELLPDRLTVERVTEMAEQTFGSEEKAQRWLHRPTTLFSNLRPIDVASSGIEGAQRVLDVLKRIDHGLAV